MTSPFVEPYEAHGPGFFFDRRSLRTLALERRTAYRDARPYPHVVIDDLLGEPHRSALVAALPSPDHPGFARREYPEQRGRLNQLSRTGFVGLAAPLRWFLAELSGMAFLDFLGTLTDIPGLIPDPHYRSAGLSLTLPGGHLALHADFNRDRSRHLARVVTVLYYLGHAWSPEWGGDLELWDHPPTRCEARYSPVLDRLIVMAHGDTYWHGHPAPLACPPDRFRAVITAYYYVAGASAADDQAHGAIWVEGGAEGAG